MLPSTFNFWKQCKISFDGGGSSQSKIYWNVICSDWLLSLTENREQYSFDFCYSCHKGLLCLILGKWVILRYALLHSQNSPRTRLYLIVVLCLLVGLPLGLMKDLRNVSRASTICIMFYAVFSFYVSILFLFFCLFIKKITCIGDLKLHSSCGDWEVTKGNLLWENLA